MRSTIRRDLPPLSVDTSTLRPPFVLPTIRQDAAPGPNHLPAAGCPFNLATTTDPYWKNVTYALTPASSYTCTATGGGYGDGTGEISWNNTTKELKVRGVVYLPGNATVTQNAFYTTYTPPAANASATIYLAGTFDYSNIKLCALRSATTLGTAMTPSGPTTISVANTDAFPASGTIKIDAEEINYSAKTTTTFTISGRARNGTVAANHSLGATVSTATGECDTRNWDPNTGNELAWISPNLPAGGARAAQTDMTTHAPNHDFTGGGSAQIQGFLYTDNDFIRSGGTGFVSGTVMAKTITTSGGASSAPAPALFSLPVGVPGDPVWTLTYIEGSTRG